MQVNEGFEPPSTPGNGVAGDGSIGADGGSVEAGPATRTDVSGAPAGLAGAPDYLVLALRQADAAMRTALTALRYARDEGRHPSGLPVERLAGLATAMTGSDVRFLSRAIEVLDAMPATWLAFQRGQLSWSQLRGIVLAARPLCIADRGWLDDQLAGVIDQDGEPDRIVDIASDLAERRREQTRPDRDVTDLDANRFVLQPTLDGRRVFGWFDIDQEGGATIAEATDAAADPPTRDDHPTDANGRQMPHSWGPCRHRASQRAEGLRRIAAAFLAGGNDRQARPCCTVILPIDTLLAGTADGPARRSGHPRLQRPRLPIDRPDATVTARLLWRLGGGRARISRTTTARLACDAQLIPLLVDGRYVPLAVGDAHAPISAPIRRAAAASDQGCRFPGCSAPAAFTDLHHVLPRGQVGPTELANLVSLCRRCHTRVHQRGWILTLHPDRTLTVAHGRHTFTSRTRLAPSRGSSRQMSDHVADERRPSGPTARNGSGPRDGPPSADPSPPARAVPDPSPPDRSPPDRSPPDPRPAGTGGQRQPIPLPF